MKSYSFVSLDRCLKARGSVESCFKCRFYMTICTGDSNNIVNNYSQKIKDIRSENIHEESLVHA
jgi:hypothetical protein